VAEVVAKKPKKRVKTRSSKGVAPRPKKFVRLSGAKSPKKTPRKDRVRSEAARQGWKTRRQHEREHERRLAERREAAWAHREAERRRVGGLSAARPGARKSEHEREREKRLAERREAAWALRKKAKRRQDKKDREIERLRKEVERLRRRRPKSLNEILDRLRKNGKTAEENYRALLRLAKKHGIPIQTIFTTYVSPSFAKGKKAA
jgi:hypothetical protein